MALSQTEALPTASFSGVSSSARQLFLLLRCVGFAAKAQVQITADGLRFTVEDSRVMQGLAFLDKALFTTYNYNPPPTTTTNQPSSPTSSSSEDDGPQPLTFQISLIALLETLQIFSVSEPPRDRYSTATPSARPPNSLFSALLPPSGLCRLSYDGPGHPLSIIISSADCTTTCSLTTYVPPSDPSDIPLSRDTLVAKIIMRASWLHDAITELSSTNPTRLVITASPTAPFFSLAARGALGSATVEFANESRGGQLLETFQVRKRWSESYRYEAVKKAGRAMAIASKVSIRGDEQGVLSLQFMVEVEGGGVSFVDFRFVPFLEEEGEGDDDGEGDDL